MRKSINPRTFQLIHKKYFANFEGSDKKKSEISNELEIGKKYFDTKIPIKT